MNYRHFLIHTSLQWFSASLFNVFGVLLFYKLTGSILGALLFYLVFATSLVIVRSLGVPILLRGINRFGLSKVMIAGLVLQTASYTVFALIDTSNYVYPLLLTFAVVNAVGATLYWTPSNTFLFSSVGSSSTPGRATAYVSVIRTLSGIAAAIVGVIAGLNADSFLLLFALGAVALLLSIVPILNVSTQSKVKVVSVRECLRKLSPAAFYANIDGARTFIELAVPLIILASFGSLKMSIWISAVVAVVAAASSYFSGLLKDRNSNLLAGTAFIGILCIWIGYGFADTVEQFVVLGIGYGVLLHILSVCGDARLGREAVNTKDVLETTVAIEFTRGLGFLIGVSILVAAYLITGSIPQMLLLLGIAFTIPRGLYAIGAIAKLK